MNNFFLKTTLIAIISVLILFSSNLALKAEQKNAVIVVYASWSVVSRDLRPVAETIAKDFKFPYVEYDVDGSNTHNVLGSLNVSIPAQTPYVMVVRNGKIVFQKAYPNSTPDLLKKDLSNELAKYI